MKRWRAWAWAMVMLAGEVHAFNKDFTIVNERAPLEFRVLFETMKSVLKDPVAQLRLVAYCERINEGLGPLKKDQAFFLFKSEVYKTMLEWRFPPSNFQPGPHNLQRIRANLENGRSVYTPFSQWVLESLTADYVPAEKAGVFAMSSAQRSALTGEKQKEALKLKRVMRFTKGWLEQADTLSIPDFNALTQELAWRVLERVNEKALLFRRFSSKAIQDTKEQTFNIPQTAMPQAAPPPAEKSAPLTPSAQGQAAEAAAANALKNLEVTPADVPTDEISGAIDKIDTAGGQADSANDRESSPPLE